MAGLGCSVYKGLGPEGALDPDSVKPKANPVSLRRKGPGRPESVGGASTGLEIVRKLRYWIVQFVTLNVS